MDRRNFLTTLLAVPIAAAIPKIQPTTSLTESYLASSATWDFSGKAMFVTPEFIWVPGHGQFSTIDAALRAIG